MEKRKGMDASLEVVLGRVHGLHAVMVSDRDGVAILQWPADDPSGSSAKFEAAFSIAADQVLPGFLFPFLYRCAHMP